MKYLIFFTLILGFTHVSEAQSRAEKKQKKKELKAKSFAELKEFFEEKNFRFEADWADTQKGMRIDLMSNPNAYVQKRDTINARLPYFGVAQVATLSGDAGITIENMRLEREEVKINEKKFRIVYSFQVGSTRGELLSCVFTIQANKSATLSIRSTQRNLISYTGKITGLE
ncbi:DUF4251 domain-containing protein [Reichenbachiella sp.]|uniref:DUF4251 domain-containing protein n=1 Tax=Reichenbachiella sp. TaxID=2184521 RepID=UPI003B597AA9